ncbi:MAG: HAD family hydrolase [Candidatus Bipolaricaulia bacterium]
MPIAQYDGVLFDLDGTLFDADYDWPWIKAQLGMTYPDGSILDYLQSLEDGERAELERFLVSVEDEATDNGCLRDGVPALLERLADLGLKRALVTNNRRRNADLVLDRYRLCFEAVVTRDDGVYKPSGEPLAEAARRIDCSPERLVYVGDNELDVRAARDAGIGHLIIISDDPDQFRGRCDALASHVDEVHQAIERLVQTGRGPSSINDR